MRRLLLAFLATVAVMVAGTLPAAAAPLPVTHWRHYTGDICMAIGDVNLNSGYIAGKWSAVSGYKVNIRSANNCVTLGYPPSRRFTLDTISRQYEACAFVTNIDGTMLIPNRDGNLNPNNPSSGEYLYSNNPRAWVNTHSSCAYWPDFRAHFASQAVGLLLGLDKTNSSGYDSRVMNNTQYSINNIEWPDNPSGSLLNFLYSGKCNASPDC
jgi:hypothetical protein